MNRKIRWDPPMTLNSIRPRSSLRVFSNKSICVGLPVQPRFFSISTVHKDTALSLHGSKKRTTSMTIHHESEKKMKRTLNTRIGNDKLRQVKRLHEKRRNPTQDKEKKPTYLSFCQKTFSLNVHVQLQQRIVLSKGRPCLRLFPVLIFPLPPTLRLTAPPLTQTPQGKDAHRSDWDQTDNITKVTNV